MKIIFQKFVCKRFYGVELEMGNEVGISHIRNIIEQNSLIPVKSCCYRATINNSYWDVKHDGSCGKKVDKFGINEGGFEVNSFKAYTIKDLNHICQIVKKLKQHNLQVNKNCGLHIHADASDFDEEQIGYLMHNWLCIEDTMFQMVPDCRRRSKYCSKNLHSRSLLALEEQSNPIAVWEHYKPKTTKLHDNLDRRLALNFVNYFRFKKLKYFHRPTIELRFPEGTLISSHVKNWVRLYLNFLNKSMNEKTKLGPIYNYGVSETLQTLGLGNNKSEFSILSPSLHETKAWFLRRICRYADYRHHHLVDEAKRILDEMGVQKI